MRQSPSSTTHHSSTKLSIKAKEGMLLARKRAMKVRQQASFGNSSSGYEFGGWKSLLEDYVESPQLSPQSLSGIGSVKLNYSSNKVNRDRKKSTTTTLCPSSPADTDNAVVFGVIEGTVESPRVAYLESTQPVTEEIQQLAEPVKPTEMMRIASPCEEKGCLHFDGSDCRLAKRIVEQLPSVTKTLPTCQIRSNCRWWKQEGKSACLRCSQVVTENYYTSPLLEEVAELNTD